MMKMAEVADEGPVTSEVIRLCTDADGWQGAYKSSSRRSPRICPSPCSLSQLLGVRSSKPEDSVRPISALWKDRSKMTYLAVSVHCHGC